MFHKSENAVVSKTYSANLGGPQCEFLPKEALEAPLFWLRAAARGGLSKRGRVVSTAREEEAYYVVPPAFQDRVYYHTHKTNRGALLTRCVRPRAEIK